MAISTNPKLTIYRNLYENNGPVLWENCPPSIFIIFCYLSCTIFLTARLAAPEVSDLCLRPREKRALCSVVWEDVMYVYVYTMYMYTPTKGAMREHWAFSIICQYCLWGTILIISPVYQQELANMLHHADLIGHIIKTVLVGNEKILFTSLSA